MLIAKGLAWGIATHGTSLLLTTLWYKYMGITVCAQCGTKNSNASESGDKGPYRGGPRRPVTPPKF